MLWGREQRIWDPVHCQRLKTTILPFMSSLVRRRITNLHTVLFFKVIALWNTWPWLYSVIKYFCIMATKLYMDCCFKRRHFEITLNTLTRYTCSFKTHLCSISSLYNNISVTMWGLTAATTDQIRPVWWRLILWYFDRKLLGRQKLERLYRNAKSSEFLQSCKCKSSLASSVTKTAKT